ncbi:hypothetical protein [Actinocrispum wychmicini]|uniref:Uncharacterized protein n=1 Tax=Actinocrispum wychmicini TaxID=1213861 RepID=A0A4V2S5K7_9PSEU|nr:hypothetical protein [Actinocrispum wychmicini]TCO52550.1 hypothetical protein EV192_112282 [Actinocrispum wychmicini]
MSGLSRGLSPDLIVGGPSSGAVRPSDPATELSPDPHHPTAPHSHAAEVFANHLNLPECPRGNNKYKDDDRAPTILTWGTPGQPATWVNQSRCASFITGLLHRTYPDIATAEHFRTHFGAVNPNSRDYRRAFADAAAPHWQPVTKLLNLRHGDVLAIDYQNGLRNQTGHVVLVRQIKDIYVSPNPALNFPGETQYAVEIIDCTSDPHGLLGVGDYIAYPDTRLIDGVNDREGVGFGHMMLYVSTSTGELSRYRWSVNSSPATTYTNHQRPMAAARFSPA